MTVSDKPLTCDDIEDLLPFAFWGRTRRFRIPRKLRREWAYLRILAKIDPPGLPPGYDFRVNLEGRAVTVGLVQKVTFERDTTDAGSPWGCKWTGEGFAPIASLTVTRPSWWAYLFGDRLHLRVREAGRELARRAWEREAATKPPPDRTPRKYRADIVKGYQPTEGLPEDAEPPNGGSGVRYPATIKVTKVSRGTLDSQAVEDVEVAEDDGPSGRDKS